MNGYYPLCFRSAKQYEEWKLLAIRSGFKGSAGYCTDCTPAYQDKMIEQRRCKRPSLDVEKLLQKELEEDIHQEIVAGELETFADNWLQMTDQLIPPPPAPVPPKKTRKKRTANVEAV